MSNHGLNKTLLAYSIVASSQFPLKCHDRTWRVLWNTSALNLHLSRLSIIHEKSNKEDGKASTMHSSWLHCSLERKEFWEANEIFMHGKIHEIYISSSPRQEYEMKEETFHEIWRSFKERRRRRYLECQKVHVDIIKSEKLSRYEDS